MSVMIQLCIANEECPTLPWPSCWWSRATCDHHWPCRGCLGGHRNWAIASGHPTSSGEGIRGTFLHIPGRIYLESCPWICMISFESDVMSLSLLWFHPELPNLWQWELFFIHLSFCPCDFPKFSHTLPSAFFPKTWEVSFSVAWASHPFLLYLPFSAPSLLPCVLAELWRWALHRPPGCECPVPVPHSALSQAAWHPWNWGFKGAAESLRSLSWAVTVSYKFSPSSFWFGLFCHSLHHSFFSTFLACDTNCFTRSSWINQWNTELPERAQYFGGEDFTEVLHITHPLSYLVLEMLLKICFQQCVLQNWFSFIISPKLATGYRDLLSQLQSLFLP